MAAPLTVTVSGAAGQIGYSLLPLLANGRVFGDRPINLRLLDVGFPGVPENLAGIKMELEDGAYPALRSVEICIAELDKAFTSCDVAILTGGFPRKKGMERKDLIAKNANIFGEQGEAIEKFASKNIKILVIANPANTNCTLPHQAHAGAQTQAPTRRRAYVPHARTSTHARTHATVSDMPVPATARPARALEQRACTG